MITKNYRVYSPEVLKKAFESSERDPIEILHDNKAIFGLQLKQVSDEVFDCWQDSDVIFSPARYTGNEKKFKEILKRSNLDILEFGWKAYIVGIKQKVHNDMRNKTELGRSIYADKDILLKIDHVSLVPKED